ncbi:hypothetical protein [Adhaeribacter terreus]|uniref:Lipoprotein n=1 Tax=Adhaeribacter terreus TaxID=529703 RepID=A0ABW0EED4_9BACT
MKITRSIFIGLLLMLSSCCPFIEEEHLGNNLYLSEYDNVDRRILYSEEVCSGSGVEIVPMTVLAYAFNSEWIIAKSGNKRTNSNIKYWIIKNKYDVEPTAEIVKSNTLGTLDLEIFSKELKDKGILLELKTIE